MILWLVESPGILHFLYFYSSYIFLGLVESSGVLHFLHFHISYIFSRLVKSLRILHFSIFTLLTFPRGAKPGPAALPGRRGAREGRGASRVPWGLIHFLHLYIFLHSSHPACRVPWGLTILTFYIYYILHFS